MPTLAGTRRLFLLGRRTPAMLVGLALAGSIWFGLVMAFVRLHMQHGWLVANIDSRLVDVGMLGLNAALLVSFVTVHLFRRSRQPPGADASSPDEASG
jgi:hypothetical protein